MEDMPNKIYGMPFLLAQKKSFFSVATFRVIRSILNYLSTVMKSVIFFVLLIAIAVLGASRAEAGPIQARVKALENCKEVPANLSSIDSVAVRISGLDPTVLYEVRVVGGQNMYFPGNDAEPFQHYGWALALTPDKCGMGSPRVCGSSNELTCCQYSTAVLGTPPPLLHAREPSTVLGNVISSSLRITGHETVLAWIEDDNCANNVGALHFELVPIQ
jgi:hypothetical protein